MTERVFVGAGRFLQRRAENYTQQSIRLYDEKLIPRLSGRPKEIAEALRPVIEKAAVVGGWSRVVAEIHLAAIGAGLAVVLGKSIKEQGVRKTFLGDSAGGTRGLVHIPKSMGEAAAAAFARRPVRKREEPMKPPAPPAVLRRLADATPDSFLALFSPTYIARYNPTTLEVSLDMKPPDNTEAMLRWDRLSPLILKHLCAVMALLPTDAMRRLALSRLLPGGGTLWDTYRRDHRPGDDQYSLREQHVHFDTFYDWIRRFQTRYDATWINTFLRRPFGSTDELIAAFARETGYSLTAHTAIRDEGEAGSVEAAKRWIRFWYEFDPYEV